MGTLPVLTQNAAEAGLAGQIHALVSQHGHDTRRRHSSKAGLVGHGQELRTLILSQGMVGRCAHGQRPAIALCEPLMCLPTLQSAHVDAGHLAC